MKATVVSSRDLVKYGRWDAPFYLAMAELAQQTGKEPDPDLADKIVRKEITLEQAVEALKNRV